MPRPWPDRPRYLSALDRLLPRVEKPTRYIGGEWNSVIKKEGAVRTCVALAFPDIYEIGMSHLGFRILYALLNEMEGVAAERAFMPWIDMLCALREEDLPLVSLETRRPLSEFDLVGFSMQYELTITNVLAMLERGGVPLLAAERTAADPLVLAGGPVVFNPEPFADFFDLILIGDAERALPEMLRRREELLAAGATRPELIAGIARSVEGWYAPALYDVRPEPGLGMLIAEPRPGSGAPLPVKRALLYDLDEVPFPERIVVPHAEIVHDRVSFEIMRGCPVGCRFCQAGYVYRPTRERDPAKVRAGVKRSLAATGYDEFSLSSLNTGEYGAIEPLLTGLMDELEPQRISVGLGSMHATTITESLAEQLRRVRKGGFTIAPEAGSQRLRDVINKNLTEEQILEATRLAFQAGWKLIKLYFMIGLPTETIEDVDAAVALAGRIARQGREIGGSRVKVTLSASTFVPKPFTPFQWCGMQTENDFVAKQERIGKTLPRGVQFRHHDHSASWLEGVLSRADRRFSRAILRAFRAGAVLDGWSEHLRVDLWREAFECEGIDADAWATRAIPLATPLPWEVVDPLVRRKWLEQEHARAMERGTLIPCGTDTCTGCAPFAKECVKGTVAERKFHALPSAPAPAPAARTLPAPETPAARPVYRYRVRFEKLGRSRFLGHLDLVRALAQSLRRAGVQLAYTQGFKPRPKLSLSPALGLGIASRAEFADLETHTPLDPERFLEAVNAATPEGIRLTAVVQLHQPAAALQDVIRRARYRAVLPDAAPEALREGAARFLAAEKVEIERLRKRKRKTIDLRAGVAALELDGEGALLFTLVMGPGGAPRPQELLAAVAGERAAASASIERVELFAEVSGRLVSPLVAGRLARAS